MFSRWNQCFRNDLRFLYFLCIMMGFEFSPAHRSPASVTNHVMTSQNYINLNMSGLDFRFLVLKFQQFQSDCFFKFYPVFFFLVTRALSIFLPFTSSWLQGPSSFVTFEGRLFHGLVWARLEMYFFSVWNLQTVFTLKPIFRKVLLFLFFFACNDGPLNSRLHMVALLAAVTMSWSAKTTWKLNMSGLDSLVPVLHISNSFDLKAFFQVLFSLLLSVYQGDI